MAYLELNQICGSRSHLAPYLTRSDDKMGGTKSREIKEFREFKEFKEKIPKFPNFLKFSIYCWI